MDGIITMAVQWLEGSKKTPGTATTINTHIVETLLAEIKRIEAVNVKMTEEIHRFETDRAKEIRLATAEACAVICETADYAVRNYGCAREIRKKFGLTT